MALSFGSTLSTKLALKNSESYWILRLYYNAGGSSDFIGVSDSYRTVDSDKYYGIVTSWGTQTQSADIFNFSVSTSGTSVTLSNAENSLDLGRFSDLFSTKNFENRKWELFQCAEGATFTEASDIIGQGVISGDVESTPTTIKFRLLDNSESIHDNIPSDLLLVSDFPNLPPSNAGEPHPASYGDFYQIPGIGTIPSGTARFDRYFTRKFPATVTDISENTGLGIEAAVDDSVMFLLDDDNIYTYREGYFIACDSANATMAPGGVGVKGATWRAYVPLTEDSTYSSDGGYDNSIDSDFSTAYNFANDLDDPIQYLSPTGWKLPIVPKIGEKIAAINIICDFGTMTGTSPVSAGHRFAFLVKGIYFDIAGWNLGDVSIDISSAYSATELSNWQLDTDIGLRIADEVGMNGDQVVPINQIGIEIEFSPTVIKVEKHKKKIERKIRYVGGGAFEIKKARTVRWTTTTREDLEVDELYASGKGREYGAWIDTIDGNARNTENGSASDPGYDSGDLIENPVYIVEDILRRELGLDPGTTGADIDIESFDTAGATPGGEIGVSLDDAVTDIKAVASINQLQNSQDVIQEICRLYGMFFWTSANGKVKIRCRLQDDGYTSVDDTIDWEDITVKNTGKTPLRDVKNDIQIDYYKNWASGNLEKVITSDDDAGFKDTTSQGTTVNGIDETQKLVVEFPYSFDETTVSNYAYFLINCFGRRKTTLDIEIPCPKYHELEICDIATFSNWPSTYKVNGYTVTQNTDKYMIVSISKTPQKMRLKLVEVT